MLDDAFLNGSEMQAHGPLSIVGIAGGNRGCDGAMLGVSFLNPLGASWLIFSQSHTRVARDLSQHSVERFGEMIARCRGNRFVKPQIRRA